MRNFKKRLGIWAVAVVFLLLVPFFLMKFQIELYDPGSGYEVPNWTLSDFIFAGVLLFSSASAYEFATRNISNRGKRIVVGALVFLILAIIWVGAATGFGAE